MPNITILSKNKNLTPYLSRNFASANFQNAENMEEKRFHREEYPLDILAEFGLTEEMIYDLPEFVHETIERGGKSPLLPITVSQPFGLTHAYAKFCLIETEDGIDVMFSPKLKAANLDSFNEDERKALLLGKVIVSEIEDHIITDEGVEDVQRIQAFVQLDRDTNGVIYTPTQVIGRNLNAVATEYGMADLLRFTKRTIKDRMSLSQSVLTSLPIQVSSSFQEQPTNGKTQFVASCRSIPLAMMGAGSTKMVYCHMFQKKSSQRTSLMNWSVLPNSMEWSVMLRNYATPCQSRKCKQTM